MSLKGTHWTRKSDNTLICIEADAESGSGHGNRSLLARNKNTGRNFWVTPEGLGRKYYPVRDWGAYSPSGLDEFHPDTTHNANPEVPDA